MDSQKVSEQCRCSCISARCCTCRSVWPGKLASSRLLPTPTHLQGEGASELQRGVHAATGRLAAVVSWLLLRPAGAA